jgi:tetratricopeptide (TPR) repeat protein
VWLVAVFVCFGWIVSLCLHEFGHAVVAYFGGDTSVKDKGYLTLNPLKYTDPGLSLLLPMLFLLMGGIALPGGAVYIDRRRLHNRWWESAVSAAGPFASALVAIVLAIPFWLGLASSESENWIEPSLAFLILLEIAAIVFNLLPIPPLDGYGIIEPWLPRTTQIQLNKLSKYGIWILFGLLWFVEPLNRLFWNCTYIVVEILGVSTDAANMGYVLFRQHSNILILGLIGFLWLFRQKHIEWYDRGNKLRKTKKYDEAIAAYDRAIQIKPDYYEAWSAKADLLYQLERYEEAIAVYEQVVHLKPNDVHSWYCRGLILGELQRYDEAIAAYERAIQIQPDFPYSWYNKACCYAWQGNIPLAIESLQQALNLDFNQFKEYAKTEPSFEAIRENQLFKDLMNEQ